MCIWAREIIVSDLASSALQYSLLLSIYVCHNLVCANIIKPRTSMPTLVDDNLSEDDGTQTIMFMGMFIDTDSVTNHVPPIFKPSDRALKHDKPSNIIFFKEAGGIQNEEI